MSHSSIAHLSIPKAALLLGLSPSHAWRKAKDGEFGPLTRRAKSRLTKGPGVHLVSIVELERITGRVYTPKQIEKAAGSPARSTTWRPKVNVVRTAPDQSVIDRAVAQRDVEWRRWAASPQKRIAHPFGPPRQLFDLAVDLAHTQGT